MKSKKVHKKWLQELFRPWMCLSLILLGALMTLGIEHVWTLKPWHSISTPDNKTTIGWIGPLSGPVSFLGEENIRSMQMAVDDYNASCTLADKRVNLVYQDDRYQSSKSVDMYDAMVSQYHPQIIFLNTYSAMFPIAKKVATDNVVLINPIDNDRFLNALDKNIFLIAKKSEELGTILANELIALKKSNILIHYNSQDEFMSSVAFGIKAKLQKSGVDVIVQDYPFMDEKQALLKIDFAQKIHPDAYIFLGYAETGYLMKEYRSAGIKEPFYAINTLAEETSGGAMEGSRILQFTQKDSFNSLAVDFLQRYRKKYDTDVKNPWVAFQAYDAMQMVLSTLQKNSSVALSTDDIRQHLLQLNNFEGLSGNISINSNGSSSGILWSMYTFLEGKLK